MVAGKGGSMQVWGGCKSYNVATVTRVTRIREGGTGGCCDPGAHGSAGPTSKAWRIAGATECARYVLRCLAETLALELLGEATPFVVLRAKRDCESSSMGG